MSFTLPVYGERSPRSAAGEGAVRTSEQGEYAPLTPTNLPASGEREQESG
jgi:hypothetical protein